MSKNKVELLTNSQFNQLVKSKAFPIIDVVTGRKFNLCFTGARNDHYDVTPQQEADAKTMEQILGRADLNQWRARPVIILAGDRMVAAGLCQFMHHIRMGGGNPGAKYPSRNEAGPPWNRGGHMCLYLSNSVGGAGNAPNAACSPEANTHAQLIQNGARGGQARAACYEAYILGNLVAEEEEEMTQEQFDEMMDVWISNRQRQAESEWSKKEGHWRRATEKKIVNGNAARSYPTREEMIAVLGRAGVF